MGNTIITASRSESQQFGINVATNGGVILLNILVGLLFTPYLIDHLGIASYGLVVLAISLTGYMGIFETAINTAVGRFLTLEIRNAQFDAANRTFNTAFWSGLVLSLILLPVVVVFSYFVPELFDIPIGGEQSARLLFAAVMGAYLLIIIRGTLTASAFSYNRLDLKNSVVATNTTVRVMVIIFLFSSALAPDAWQVGVGTLSGAILSFSLAFWIWRALTPELGFDRKLLDMSSFKNMFSMSGWLLINQMGALLFLNIDLLIINRYLGVETQGRYGAILQLVILLRTLAIAISSAITPIALRQFAGNDSEHMILMTRSAIKWMGLIFALPIGCLAGVAGSFLALWLGNNFSNLAPLAVIMVVPLCFNLSILPLFSIRTTLNKVRWPGIINLASGLLNLVLAVRWVHWENTGLGVALAGAIVLTINNVIFNPLYGAHILNLPKSTFYRDIFPGIIGTLVVSIISIGAAKTIEIDSWGIFLVVTGVISLFYAAGLYFFAMNEQEREHLHQFVLTTLHPETKNG